MNKYQEEPSLLEVRAWKEQCYREDRHLTDAEYLKKLKEVTARLKAEYQSNLPPANRPVAP
jgi:hypothetical protein